MGLEIPENADTLLASVGFLLAETFHANGQNRLDSGFVLCHEVVL